MGENVQKLDLAIEYSLLGTVFFLALSPVLTNACLIVGTLLWAVKMLAAREKFKRPAFFKPLLFFILFGALSVAASPDKFFSAYNYVVLMGSYMAIYFITLHQVKSEGQIKKLALAAALAAIIAIGYGFYQYFHGIDVSTMLWVDGEQFPELKTRVFSTLENPNIFAGYLLTVLCMAFAAFLKLEEKKYKIFAALLFLAAAACLGMTYCRGAWLTFAAVLAIYTWKNNKRLFLLFLAAAAVIVALEPAVQQRLFSSFGVGDTSSEMRMAMWESTIAMIIDKPLFGIGWGAYWMVYPEYDFYINDPSVLIVHAHNLYLNYMAEIGLVGAFGFFACMAGHLYLALEKSAPRASAFLNALALGAGLSIVCIMINGITDFVLFNIQLSLLYWFLNAIIEAVCRSSVK
jgi:putative inorganic carbon (HCO3(-)) transporter